MTLIEMALFLRLPPIYFHPRHTLMNMNANLARAKMANTATPTVTEKRKLPILLFDVMDTLVRDPFYQDVPAFFGYGVSNYI